MARNEPMPKVDTHHVRMSGLDRSIDFYVKAFGLGIAGYFNFDGFTLVHLRNDESDMMMSGLPRVRAWHGTDIDADGDIVGLA